MQNYFSSPFGFSISGPIRQISHSIVLGIVILFSTHISGQTFADDGDFIEAAKAAIPGAVIVLKDGTYTDVEGRFSDLKGTKANPITIKAETVGGVVLTKESVFSFKRCEYIILEGFVFDCEGENTLVKLEGSNNIRITRNVFELKTVEPIKWVFIGGIFDDFTFQFTSHHNRIDHNIFQNKATPGHYITVDGTNDGEEDYRQSQYDRIDHNHFKNNSPRAVNEQESIRVGWSKMSNSSGFTTVEFNLFEDCDGDPEIVSVKSSDNIVRHNTFRKSYGVLSLRHGNRTRVEGNYFLGEGKPVGLSPAGSKLYTGGIRVYGTDHVIINNYMEGLNGTGFDAPIALTQGDAIDGQSSDLTKHFIAERVVFAYNTLVNNEYGIEIGFDNKGKYSKKVTDVSFINNLVTGTTNSLVEYVGGRTQSGGVNWENNLMFPAGTAMLQVGNPTAFTAAEVQQADPKLAFQNAIWSATADTPKIANATEASLVVNTDIEGQARPALSNPGADHFSMETIRFKPLTTTDVGPLAPEGEIGPEVDSIIVSSVTEFLDSATTQTVNVTANVDWSVENTSSWITLSASSGANNGTFDITVSENATLDKRTATVTVTDGTIVRNITVSQQGKEAPIGSDKLTIVRVTASSEQTPDNVKENTIDGDLGTRWSALGVGETITFDLGQVFDLSLVKIAVLKGSSRTSTFDITVSMDGTNFTTVLETQSSNGTNGLTNYPLASQARYVRIVGGGNSENEWNSITEVEIFGNSATLAVTNSELASKFGMQLYPNPVTDQLYIQRTSLGFNQIAIYGIDGIQVLSKIFNDSQLEVITVSSLAKGMYFVEISDGNQSIFQRILISK